MKRFNIMIIVALLVTLMAGCSESNYLSLTNDLKVSTDVPTYTNNEQLRYLDSYVDDNEKLQDTNIPSSGLFLIEEFISYHQGIFEMSPDTANESIGMWLDFKKNHSSYVNSEYSQLEQNNFTSRLKFDIAVMQKSNYDGELFYDVKFDNVKKGSNGKYYVPIMIYMKVENFDKVNIDDIAKEVSKNNGLKYANVKSHYDEMIDFYSSNEGKYIVLSKSYIVYSDTYMNFPEVFNTVVTDENISSFIFESSIWSVPYIEEAYNLNFVTLNEYSDYRAQITRKEFSKLIVLLYESLNGEIKPADDPFVDTDDIYVKKAKAIDLMQGVGNNMFSPNSILTREQIATVLSRYLEKTTAVKNVDYTDIYTDDSQISSWAYSHVYRMKNLTIMVGYENAFRPVAPITIEEAITTIVRNISTNN